MKAMKVRIMIAVVVSVVGLTVLGVVSVMGGGGEDPEGSAPTSHTLPATAPTSVVPAIETPVVEVPEDWMPKGSSLYSDREPSSTIAEPEDGFPVTTSVDGD